MIFVVTLVDVSFVDEPPKKPPLVSFFCSTTTVGPSTSRSRSFKYVVVPPKSHTSWSLPSPLASRSATPSRRRGRAARREGERRRRREAHGDLRRRELVAVGVGLVRQFDALGGLECYSSCFQGFVEVPLEAQVVVVAHGALCCGLSLGDGNSLGSVRVARQKSTIRQRARPSKICAEPKNLLGGLASCKTVSSTLVRRRARPRRPPLRKAARQPRAAE